MQPLSRRWKLFAIFLIMGLVASAVVMFSLAEFHEEIGEPFLFQLDRQVQTAVHAHATPWLTRIMFASSWIGSPAELFPAIPVIAGLMWWRRLRDEAVVLMVAMVGGGLLEAALKLHFRRVRPDVPWAFVHEHSYSFPSGHSVLAVALYGTAVYLAMRHLRGTRARVVLCLAASLLIVGIGLSRIYLGVHYPSDVAAGYLVGAIWLSGVMASDWYARQSEEMPGD